MIAPVRLAGWGRRGDTTVTWTIAEGRRGRRWREAVARGDAMVHALLLETGPDGRFSHLELATATGLLTLHPEPDGTLHGNRVATGGGPVEPIAGLPFGSASVVVVAGSPISVAADVWALASGVGPDSALLVPAAVVDAAGRVTVVPVLAIERLDERRWRLGEDEVEIDERGVPLLDGPAPTSTEV